MDYGELFCQAVDTIIKQRLESISYDKTILCTVIDDSLRAKGLYTVTNNGTTKFDAFSSNTSYNNNDNVYVQIPEGDWNQQKIIIAKKTNKNNEPYVYQKPFASLVDITGNLISSNINSNETGLIANNDEYVSITLWTYNVDNPEALRREEGIEHTGYTRLGIQAGFQSWLNPFYITSDDEDEASTPRYVVQGDYGLRLRLVAVDETTSKDSEDRVAAYDLYLNCADMNGNPYDFESFYSQEKVFDISSIKGNITQMELQFYQKPGSFIDKNGNLIPYKDFLGNYIKPNLYVSDAYISLGYDISEFEDEMVQIYTFDSTTYSRTADPLTNNHKLVHLRWIHKMPDGSFKSITEKDELDYEIRWYRFELGHSSADNYSGVYWKNLSTQSNLSGDVIYEIKDPDWITYNKTCEVGYLREPSFFKTWQIPDTTLQEEQIKAIIIYDGKPYRSNILVATNEDEVVSKPTVDAVQALSIHCDDNTYGNYRIYKLGNNLIDQAQSSLVREWRPFFKSITAAAEAAPTELVEAESIEWIIPTDKTMIIIDDSFKGGDAVISTDSDKRLHIIRYGSGIKGNDISAYNTQQYRIRSYYSQNYSDNTIQCKIVKDKITYTAVKELTFGTSGTSGTDCTFVLDFDDGKTAVVLGSTNAVTVSAKLYDYENNEIDLSGYNIKWGWKTQNTDVGLKNLVSYVNTTDSTVELKPTGESIGANYHILQATLTGWGDYDLVAYLPIPVKTSTDYAYISGTTQVIYETSGEVLDYFQNPYAMYKADATEIFADWSSGAAVPHLTNTTYALNGVDGEEAYTPKIIKDKNGLYRLEPLSIYVNDASQYIGVTAKVGGKIVWSQPILIMKNRYPSAMINGWDGSLDVGVTDPGTILAARIAAGRKETGTGYENTFTGVIMGDWGLEDSEGGFSTTTGLFGFHRGEQSFGFRDDGTAFIGKDGKGRILFDGDNSTITSTRYVNNQGGMILDFDDGLIQLINPNNATKRGQITIDAAASRTPFTIGTNFSVDWDGTIYANNGNFSGSITSSSIHGSVITGSSIYVPSQSNPKFSVTSDGYLTAEEVDINGRIVSESGSIGGWIIGKNTLSSKNGTLVLDSSDGSITGGILRTPSGGMILDGYLVISDGEGNLVTGTYLGYMEANLVGDTSDLTTAGVGFKYQVGSVLSQVKTTGANAGLSYQDGSGGGYITINNGGVLSMSGSKLDVRNIPAEQQFGVYARFA